MMTLLKSPNPRTRAILPDWLICHLNVTGKVIIWGCSGLSDLASIPRPALRRSLGFGRRGNSRSGCVRFHPRGSRIQGRSVLRPCIILAFVTVKAFMHRKGGGSLNPANAVIPSDVDEMEPKGFRISLRNTDGISPSYGSGRIGHGRIIS